MAIAEQYANTTVWRPPKEVCLQIFL